MARWTRCSPISSIVRNVANRWGAHTARGRAAALCTMCAEVNKQIQNASRSRSRVSTSNRRSSSSWNRFWDLIATGLLFLQHSLERITYDSRTREVRVALVDSSQFGYTLPLARRPGVRRSFEEQQAYGRVPRLSRLMALALRFQDLLSNGIVRNRAALAELGHVSRVRVC